MSSTISLQALNLAAACLHLFQACIVLAFIPKLNNQQGNTPLMNGIFALRKNVYVLRNINTQPQCSLPMLYNTTSTSNPNGVTLNLLLQQSNTELLQITSSDFYQFKNSFAIPTSFVIGYMDVRYLIFCFFLLSFLFQIAEGMAGTYSLSNFMMVQKPRILRFVEYSFSASLMIMGIALEVGLTDIYILCCIFTLIFTTNLLGLIAEVMCFMAETSRSEFLSLPAWNVLPIPPIWLWTIPHFLGWITCIMGYAPLLDAYLASTQCSDTEPPGFVNVIIFLEFCLFICFGGVQMYSLYYKTCLLATGPTRQTTPNNNYAYVPQYNTTYSSYDDGTDGGTNFSQSVRGVQSEEMGKRGTGELIMLSPSEQITYQADFAYIILSFTAKTLLAWLVLAPVLTSL